MRRVIEIKGHRINGGRPVICVPIVARDEEEICRQAKEFVARGARMVEWRLDFFDRIHEDGAILGVLGRLGEICEGTILLVTIRSKRQGGSIQLEERKLIHLLELLAKSGKADLLDLEFFELTDPARVIEKVQAAGVRVITSHHDFDETPPKEVMTTLLEQMEEGGSDLVKIAVMPRSARDVLDLLSVTNAFYEDHPQTPIISMSMGSLGLVSRLSGQTFGSCVTFAVMGESSAPGQPGAEELERTLDFMEDMKKEG